MNSVGEPAGVSPEPMLEQAAFGAFVFVRYWPDFTESFPYELLNDLADEKIEQELRIILLEQQWRGYRTLLDKIHKEDKRRTKVLNERRRLRAVGSPSGVTGRMQAHLRKQSFRLEPPCGIRLHLGRVGWCCGIGQTLTKHDGEWCSRRIWLANPESAEIAKGLADYLAKLTHPTKSVEQDLRETFNPRYGYVRADDLSVSEQLACSADIDWLRSEEPMDQLGEITRRLTSRHIWRYLGGPAAGAGALCVNAGATTSEQAGPPLSPDIESKPVTHAPHSEAATAVDGKIGDDPDFDDLQLRANRGAGFYSFVRAAAVVASEHPDAIEPFCAKAQIVLDSIPAIVADVDSGNECWKVLEPVIARRQAPVELAGKASSSWSELALKFREYAVFVLRTAIRNAQRSYPDWVPSPAAELLPLRLEEMEALRPELARMLSHMPAIDLGALQANIKVELIEAANVRTGKSRPPTSSHLTDHDQDCQRYYLKADIRRLTDLGDDTITYYCRVANVTVPGRGKRNHKWSTEEVVRILNAIINGSGNERDRQRATEALAKLKRIDVDNPT